GLAFSPDYKKLYVISTGRGPGDAHAGGNRDMHVFDVAGNNKLSSQKLFADFMIDGIKCGPDGVRADVYGNRWVSSNGNPGGRSPMGPGGRMHEERVTDVDVAPLALGEHLLTFEGRRRQTRRHLPEAEATLARRGQHAGHVEV